MKLSGKRFDEYKLCQILVAVFILSLIPILVCSLYATPRYDDFSYGISAHRGYLQSGIAGAVKGALHNVYTFWHTWQGTYSAIFLFSLQPAVFSTNFYGITGFVMLFSLIFSQWLLMETIFVKWLGLPRNRMWLILIPVLFSEIQFMPSKFEGIYWFNGASYYTLFFALELVLHAMMIRQAMTNSVHRRRVLGVLNSILAVVLGGANYTTALITAIILACFLMEAFVKRRPVCGSYMVTFLLFMIGFAVSALAPGNSVRAKEVMGMPVFSAIAASFYKCGVLIVRRTWLATLAAYLFISPILMDAAGRCKLSFRYPLAFVLFVLGCTSAQFTPALYAMGSVGALRQVNIYFYGWHLAFMSCLFYVFGWLIHVKSALKPENVERFWQSHLKKLSAGLAVLFLMGCFYWAPGQTIRQTGTVSAAVGLARGQVQRTKRDFLEIESKLQTESGVCRIHDVFVNQNLSAGLGISGEDENSWIAVAMASYYECEAIVVVE